ncbi:MAG: cytochrome d ubiquinol oxidase subunit II [Simkaniaceae bacterium]|nr:cytochrome d ubiquinol oxidase subunit II [Candidatus Sacchlamyda saccharinae]
MLALIWYFVIILAMICYAMLDGFDLGVGLLHLFAKDDRDRRIFLNAIGPVWDGNEVWLVIVGGALFAGFPDVFATLCSTFYIPVMVLLMGLIFRAVSIEFRSKHESKRWRKCWDVVFALGSLVISFGVGVVLGNLIYGIPLDADNNFTGTFSDFIHPYALLVGVTTVALFAMHGAIFLVMKTEGALHEKVRSLVPRCIGFFLIMYILITVTAVYYRPYMIDPMRAYPILYLVPLIALVAIISVPFLMQKKWDGWAFVSSSLSIAGLLSLAAIGTFPYMIRSTVHTQTNSLTIYNSASSELTLKVLLIIVAIGVPLVLAYGFYVYRTFRGKVELDATSY